MRDSRSAVPRRQQARTSVRALASLALRRNRSEGAREQAAGKAERKGNRRRIPVVVIADAERATALAGVMGGQDSEVRATTTDILLESAYFDPATVLELRVQTPEPVQEIWVL